MEAGQLEDAFRRRVRDARQAGPLRLPGEGRHDERFIIGDEDDGGHVRMELHCQLPSRPKGDW
ncbi:hypothetical protein MFU01_24160 [Myxococcus fulvus]|uniref:Uncharacterized protein n=1 Tax=Myxococcus fulvus TaxID=33 RepID=A0A511SZQ3_MYXFU|nr:hypothetical protein MFU01_24160 [Myxococcus fulvus]